MEQRIYLLNMFSEYEPPEELRDALNQAAIAAADIDMENRGGHVMLHSEHYIPQRILNFAAREICRMYGLKSLTLDATHPADQLQKIEKEELMNLFVSRNSMTRGSLAGARWEWNGSALEIHLKANGRDAILELVPQVEQELRQRFDTDLMISVIAGNALEGQALFDAMEDLRSKDRKQLFDFAKALRFDPKFPKGANINFYDFVAEGEVRVLTYERGVEDYTLACGTGCGSTAAVLNELGKLTDGKLICHVPGGTLTVTMQDGLFLEGPAVVVKEYEV